MKKNISTEILKIAKFLLSLTKRTVPLVPQFHNNRDRPYSNPKLQRSFNLYSRGAGAAMSPSKCKYLYIRDRPYLYTKLPFQQG